METYNIYQAVDKTVSALREDLTEIKSVISDKFIEKVIQLILPPVISCVLTAVSYSPTMVSVNSKMENSKPISGILINVLIFIFIFCAIAVVTWLVIRLIIFLNQKDEKESAESRNDLRDFFYRIILPEIDTAKKLLEKAEEEVSKLEKTGMTEGEVQKPKLEAVEAEEIDYGKGKQNILLYYKALYHFEVVYREFQRKNLIEYSDSHREEYNKFIKEIHYEVLKNVIDDCLESVGDICEKLKDSEAKKLYQNYSALSTQLKSHMNG